ncbi:PhzF family phenazine biosynthesis protein [Jatrophihabitans sp.]|uniref:PhzF family phenazine biosynthesis protein n=1 Tax=Jatrophihabitans sp. TaxID=1932789 RepID=UPI0030C71601|nr:PhzF family phenazine biosynthesis isomerase [Jatrophihabitans sp.]
MTSTEWMTVFADGTGGGNPCPVVFDFAGPTEQMQAMAAGFGVETVFVLPATGEADAELRYFVPRHEMEMCVHATIAAVTLLFESGACAGRQARVATALGVLDVDWDPDAARAVVAQFPAVFGEPVAGEARRRVLQALAIGADRQTGEIVAVSTARPKLMVPLIDEATLDGLQPDFELLWRLCDELGVTGLYPFARLDGAAGTAQVAARQFPSRTGYPEDPATGVAACALGAYLTAASAQVGWQSWRIAQGRALGRPSLITAEARRTSGGAIAQSRVGGQARRLRPDESRTI